MCEALEKAFREKLNNMPPEVMEVSLFVCAC